MRINDYGVLSGAAEAVYASYSKGGEECRRAARAFAWIRGRLRVCDVRLSDDTCCAIRRGPVRVVHSPLRLLNDHLSESIDPQAPASTTHPKRKADNAPLRVRAQHR
ncbi:hypothetical protein HN011_007254 [Eciton burchellii]|nr:hypothetical protein HN011_007254 [Eciton burchellii]